MPSGVYTQFLTELMRKTIDMVNDDIKCNLMDNVHTFTKSNLGWASVSANEVSGTGYPNAQSNVLQNPSVTQDDGDGEAVFDANDISWTGATLTARHAVLYDDTPTSPADPLVASIDFGADQSVNNGTFTIQWDGEGIINIA